MAYIENMLSHIIISMLHDYVTFKLLFIVYLSELLLLLSSNIVIAVIRIITLVTTI